MTTRPKIFISYAREDYEAAEQIYDRLLYAGFKPWMDKKDILPGAMWENSIKVAIRNADFVLVCLSSRSVGKRGFLQREIKEALDLWREKLEDDIYLIPVRLEECVVPESLSRFQWVDFYKSNQWIVLLKAIHKGMERLGIQVDFQSPSGEFKLKSEKFFESKDSTPSYTIDVEYPRIEGLSEQSLRALNIIIEGRILEIILRFKSDYYSHELNEWLSEYTSELSGVYEATLITDSLISVKFDYYQYSAGAAHGMSKSIAFNYQLNPLLCIDLFNLFRSDLTIHPLEIISQYCIADLIRQAKSEGHIDGGNDSWVSKDGASPRWENYEIFNITERSLVFTFVPYQVGPYAWGTRVVEIPFLAIKDYLEINSPLEALLSTIN